jgi:hypothetical protein
MKNLLILFALLIFSGVSAQSDSTVIRLIGGVYYNVSFQMVDSVRGTSTTDFSGDGTADGSFNVEKGKMLRAATEMTTDAQFVSGFSKRLTEIVRLNNDLKALYNRSPLDTIQAAYSADFLRPGWTIRENGAVARNIVFSINAAGNFRHKVGSDAAKSAIIFGDVIRLLNYPTTGGTKDFYKIKNGNLVTLDRDYILRKPGSNQALAQPKKKK